ncbi:Uncharacterised protein [Slackia heliotrinireducens]|nr:Uncharacterised protein [Slackia heliotrinireducens]
MRRPARVHPASFPASESRCSQTALAQSFEIHSMLVTRSTLCTLRVLVPVTHNSATAARSTHWYRSSTSSGKKFPRAQLRDAMRQRADADCDPVLAVAVAPAGRRLAKLASPCTHGHVSDALSELQGQLPHVREPVLEPRCRRRCLEHRVCYAVHCSRCLLLESDLQSSQILGSGRSLLKRALGRSPSCTNIYDTINDNL